MGSPFGEFKFPLPPVSLGHHLNYTDHHEDSRRPCSGGSVLGPRGRRTQCLCASPPACRRRWSPLGALLHRQYHTVLPLQHLDPALLCIASPPYPWAQGRKSHLRPRPQCTPLL